MFTTIDGPFSASTPILTAVGRTLSCVVPAGDSKVSRRDEAHATHNPRMRCHPVKMRTLLVLLFTWWPLRGAAVDCGLNSKMRSSVSRCATSYTFLSV